MVLGKLEEVMVGEGTDTDTDMDSRDNLGPAPEGARPEVEGKEAMGTRASSLFL